jgi:histidinol dehydrogenase
MSFLRHVGKHGDRKVAVIFRQVPNEEHMCLVAYTQLLNQNIHDPLMATIESDIGQNSEELADALNRQYTKSGDRILQVLHAEGMLKKIRTEDVVMTPGPNTSIRLDELNKILGEMAAGQEATKKLAEADASLGMQDPADVRRRREGLIGDQNRPMPTAGTNAPADPNMAMNDDVLARDFMAQAERMEADAKGLIAESKRLMKEAKAMMPKPARKTTAKKTTRKKTAAK